MSADLRSTAEALAVALEHGITSVGDVIAWADRVILAEDHPHWSICDLAIMGKSPLPHVVWALRDVPGEVDEASVRQEVIRLMARALVEDRSRADAIVSALFDLAVSEQLPDKLCSVAYWASDGLSLADDGIGPETRDQVIDTTLAALQAAASLPQGER